MDKLTRRTFLGVTSVVGVGAIVARAADAPAAAPAPAAVTVSDTFPSQSPEVAREMVGVSLGNATRVQELL